MICPDPVPARLNPRPRAARAHRARLQGAAVWGVVLLLAAGSASAYNFPRVPALEGNVSFWKRVYAVWSVNEIAFHDRHDLGVVLGVVKVAPRGKKRDGLTRREGVRQGQARINAALDRLHRSQPSSADGLSGVELDVYRALEHKSDPDKYRKVELRAQNGLRERFVRGYKFAGLFEAQIKQRLAKAGLPPDIIALAYVESLMDLEARSHAGAVGPWQFMKPTAREYMNVHGLLDERHDPIIATDAAAKYLNTARKTVGPWPVAITSYNYGRGGMRKAIRATGSDDLGVILRDYRHGRFGFAARNYYASFIAVHDVLENPERYFGKVQRRRPWRYDVIRLPFEMSAKDLYAQRAITKSDLRDLNPALTDRALRGSAPLPRGLSLRVPQGLGDIFLAKVNALPAHKRKGQVKHVERTHVVKRGQSLTRIARKYGVTVAGIANANGMSRHDTLLRGQKLRIPPKNVRYTLLPEARGLPMPGAPADTGVAVAVRAPSPPPAVAPAPAAPPKVAAAVPPMPPVREVAAPEPAPKKKARVKKKRRARRPPEPTGPTVKLVRLTKEKLPSGRALPAVDLVTTARPDTLPAVDVVAGPPPAEPEPSEPPLSVVPTS